MTMSKFCCTGAELALKKRFEDAYAKTTDPIMKKIERQVCGSDYGGNSWTTREQADELVSVLRLGSATRLIDLGSGTGWPGLYLAKQSNCSVCLVDLPENGLQIAKMRAAKEGLSNRAEFHVADAADLPFLDDEFDAVCHSDLLCCLVRKRGVLENCRRVIRKGGTMAFTVISVAPGLSANSYERALANAPEFIESDTSYSILLEETGWHQAELFDLTQAYRDSCSRQISSDEEFQDGLTAILGRQQAAERLENWRSKLRAIDDGLFRRELFVCTA